MSWSDELMCCICGFQSASNLVSHICRKHRVTIEQYKLQFPGAIVMRISDEQRQKQSRAMKKRLEDPVALSSFMEWRSFPSELKHWLKKGLSMEEAQVKVSTFQSNASLHQNDYPEMLAKKAERQSGENNPMSLTSIAARHDVTLEEAKMLTPCFGRTGEKHPMFGKHHTETAKQQIAENMHVTFSNTSAGEIELQDELKRLFGDRVLTNNRVLHYNCDVVFSDVNVIVEYMGEFWHPHAGKFSPDWVHPRTERTAREMWERDDVKVSALKEAGYHVVVVRGDEWAKQRDDVLARVKHVVDKA